MDPSKPTEPWTDQPTSIPRSRPRSEDGPRLEDGPRSADGPSEALVGEVIPKGVPIGRPTVDAQPRGRPPTGLGGPGSPAGAAKKGKLRRAFIVVAALAVGLCLGGVAITYALYDKATTPDRSSPTVTLQQYLDEKFENRNDQKAASLVCRAPRLDAIDAMLADIKSREAKFGVAIDVKSSDVVVTQSDSNAGIDANLKISTTVNGAEQRDIERWHFDLVRESGWRVCAASQAS